MGFYCVAHTLKKLKTFNEEDLLTKSFIPSNLVRFNSDICQIPVLELTNNHDKSQPEKKCILKKEWGFIENNTWYFDSSVLSKLNDVQCEYRALFRQDDFKYTSSNWSNLHNEQLIQDEVFEVRCSKFLTKNKFSIYYQSIFIQFFNKLKPKSTPNSSIDSKCKPLNIMLISYDSVSRASWLKRLPKTNKYIFDEMKFDLLEGYNIVGDGTPAALIPIFTGKTEEELPNVLLNNPKAKYVDEEYPFIWKELHKKNYITMYLDDWPHLGAFMYRMKGFSNYTCHHYYKHYQIRLWELIGRNHQFKNAKNDDFCIGSEKRHKKQLDLIEKFKKTYNSLANNFIIMHYVENSHNTNERFNWVDNDLYELFSNGYKNKLFENTAIFLYSDHGSRFVDKRSSLNRYLEERMPFFAVYLPDEYKLNNREKYSNFNKNKKYLTSPFDIHATVRDLTCLKQLKPNKNYPQRSFSLLDSIKPRTCDDIGISDHFCICKKNWIGLPISNVKVFKAVKFTIDSINNITQTVRNLCSQLVLKEIISAETIRKNESNLIRIQFITWPNKGVFESIVYDTYKQMFEFSSVSFSIRSRNDISRIDSYGEQPKCVSNFTQNPSNILDLRKFCYCTKKKVIRLG